MQVGDLLRLWVGPAQSAALRPGQVLVASVQSVQGDRVRLQIEGALLEAHTQVPLQPGAQIRLQVVSVDPAQIQLRLLPPPAPPAAPTPKSATAAAPAPLPPAGANAAGDMVAARALLAHQLPVTPETLQPLARLVQSFAPAQQEAAAAAAAWLLAHGQPLDAATVRNLERALSDRPWSLARRLADLAQTVERAAADAPAALAERWHGLARALRRWGYTPGRPPADLTALLAAGAEPAPEDATAARELLAAVRHLADAPPRAGDLAVFPLPIHLGQWHGEALLVVHREPHADDGGAGGTDAPRLSLYLEPPHLGPLLVTLSDGAAGVAATVTAADAEAAAYLRTALPRLGAALQARGIQPGPLLAGTGPVSPPQPVTPPVSEWPRGIDLRV